MNGPLQGLKIVEFVGLGPTSFTAMMLADMGANVIRIDRKGSTEKQNPYPALGTKFDVMARSRGRVELDLKCASDKEVAVEIVAHADALLEGYRPGAMERLGLGPTELLARNPRLVYTRITGWGQTGPLAHQAGHDINYIALSGMLGAMGTPGKPPFPPLNLVGDFAGGGMLAAFGVLCGIMYAQRTGQGQIIDAAMLDGANLMGAMIYGFRSMGKWSLERGRNWIDGSAPYYGCYECCDGKYVAIGPIEPQFLATLFEVAEIDPNLFQDITDIDRWPKLRRRLAKIFRQKNRDEWCTIFEGTDACVAPVLDVDEAVKHPQNVARDNFVEINGVIHPMPSPRFSETPGNVLTASIDLHELLKSWGLSAQSLNALRNNQAI